MRQRSRRETAAIASDQTAEAIKRLAKQPGKAKDIADHWREAAKLCQAMANEWQEIANTLEAPYRIYVPSQHSWRSEEFDTSEAALRFIKSYQVETQIWKGDKLFGLWDADSGFRFAGNNA